MQALLLSVHVVAGILFIGPVAVAASLFPRYAPVTGAGSTGSDRNAAIAVMLYRITRVYGLLALVVPVIGLALALVQGRATEIWVLAAMVLTTAAGASLTRGVNAEYKVNGGETLISTSNTFSSASHGIAELAVTATSVGAQTVTVGADTAKMKGAIQAFIDKFNAVQTFIDEQTRITSANGKVTASTLSNNREVQTWAQTFRSAAFSAVAGLSGTISRLEQLGIDFTSGTSQLEIKNPSKLDAALADHPGDVEAFFTTANTGLADRFSTLFTSFTGADGTGGLLKAQKEALNKSNTDIERQIADIDRRLESRRAQMEAAFIAMEQAQSKLQQMQTQLTNSFFKDSSK